VTDHETNKPAFLFILSHNTINAAGSMKKIALLCFPKNLTTEYQSKRQCFLLLQFVLFTETP